MANATTRCNGAFIAHTLATGHDPSIWLSVQLSESLLEHKEFNPSDVVSRYLFMCHTEGYALGQVTTQMYQVVLDTFKTRRHTSSFSRQDFLLDRPAIGKAVKLVDTRLHGQTAGCGPVHRSFPLALYPGIEDGDLFERSMEEAQLTHAHPVAGQVAGIVNLICRGLLRDSTWDDAVESAFSVPRLHNDLLGVRANYSRCHVPDSKKQLPYAPNALQTALYYINDSKDALDAIGKARSARQSFSLAIVGILAGMRWGVPLTTLTEHSSKPEMKRMLEAANRFAHFWDTEYSSVKA